MIRRIMPAIISFCAIACSAAAAAQPSRAPAARADEKVCGVYTSVVEFASPKALKAAADAGPYVVLKPKHITNFAKMDNSRRVAFCRDAGFNTLFMTIYPLWGRDWWTIPAGRGLITDAVAQVRGSGMKVHLGLSIFNGDFCTDPSKYPGASRTIQCDGTRPDWVCFFDDALWKTFIKNAVEMAKVSKEYPDIVDGFFLDPEAYGSECYLCFCHNCIHKFNAYAKQDMPEDVVKPDGWLKEHRLWKKYAVEWHDHEVLRHANEMRDAVHSVNPKLQLGSLLWDYPVAVGQDDARAAYYRNLAIGLGTPEQPAWTLPEHTYYSDAADVNLILGQMQQDLVAMNAADRVKIVPGIRVLRRPAASLIDRGKVIHDNPNAAGYWMYELADLQGKHPIDFEGTLLEPEAKYVQAFREMNKIVRAPVSTSSR